MVLDGFKPTFILICILNTYNDAGFVNSGRLFHSYIVKERLERDKYIGTTLINMYTKCGAILDGYKIFQGLDDPNVVFGYIEYKHDEED